MSAFPLPRELAPSRPWIITTIAVVFFIVPGLVFALAASHAEQAISTIVSIGWAALGWCWAWSRWHNRDRETWAKFTAALEDVPRSEVVARLEDPEIDDEELFYVLAYLGAKHPGWSGRKVPTPAPMEEPPEVP